MEKFIKEAILKDITYNYIEDNELWRFTDLSNYDIKLDLSFAQNIRLGDTFWFNDNKAPHEEMEYPYILNFSDELLEKWSDGWYQVVRKNYEGTRLVFEVIEINCEQTEKYLFSSNLIQKYK